MLVRIAQGAAAFDIVSHLSAHGEDRYVETLNYRTKVKPEAS